MASRSSLVMVNRFALALGSTGKPVQKLRFLSASFGAQKFNNRLTRNCSTSSANAYVVTEDEKYGNKQIISVTPRLYDYILQNVREPEVRWTSSFQSELRERCSFCCCFFGFFISRFCFRYFGNSGRRLLLCVVAKCRYSSRFCISNSF